MPYAVGSPEAALSNEPGRVTSRVGASSRFEIALESLPPRGSRFGTFLDHPMYLHIRGLNCGPCLVILIGLIRGQLGGLG